jgi:hypothetical protein
MASKSASRVIAQGERCTEHGELWRLPWPRERGKAVEYVGHVRVDTTDEGAVFVCWHPMALWPGSSGQTAAP